MLKLDALTECQLQKACREDVCNTPKQCKTEYLGQLACLQRRLRKTTEAFEGGQCFRDDVDNLLNVYEAIEQVGVGKIFSLDVSTPRRKRKMNEELFATTPITLPNRRVTRRSGM